MQGLVTSQWEARAMLMVVGMQRGGRLGHGHSCVAHEHTPFSHQCVNLKARVAKL